MSKSEHISQLVKRIISHELVSGSFFVFLSSMASNILAFILNLFLIRSLTSIQYGTFASLISLLTLSSIPTQSLNNVIVQFATRYFSSHENGKAIKLYVTTLKAITLVGIIFFLFFIVSARSMSAFLRISDTNLFVLLGIIIGLSYVSIVNTAFLQSLLRFGLVSFLTFLGTLLKFGGGVLFVLMGFGVVGVLWALIIMLVGPLILSFFPLASFFKDKKTSAINISLKEIFSYAVPASIAVICLTSFTSTDILLVKHFFPPMQAGLYAGVALIGKIIFYFTMPIPMVMFPLVIKRHSQGKGFHSLFYLSLLLVAVPSLCITAFYFVFPQFSIRFLLGGGTYLRIAPYVGWFGFYLSIFSVLNVLVTFLLSVKETKPSYLLAAGAVLQFGLIFVFHKNFFQIILISTILVVLLLISLLLYYLHKYGKKIR